jgi:hypothetical protein
MNLQIYSAPDIITNNSSILIENIHIIYTCNDHAFYWDDNVIYTCNEQKVVENKYVNAWFIYR